MRRCEIPQLSSRLPQPRPGHRALEFAHYRDTIDEQIRSFEELTAGIQRLRKLLDESLLTKRRALKENRRVYLSVARIQENYYRLAGLGDLADRIRTEVHKISRPRIRSPEGGIR